VWSFKQIRDTGEVFLGSWSLPHAVLGLTVYRNGDEKLSKIVYASRSPYVVGGRLYLFCCLAGQGRRFTGEKTEKIEFLLDCEHRIGSGNRSQKISLLPANRTQMRSSVFRPGQ
jgi:hypothetical protein